MYSCTSSWCKLIWTGKLIDTDVSRDHILRIGAKPIQFNVPTPKLKDTIPVRSTGSCYSFEGYDAILPALSSCDLIIDCAPKEAFKKIVQKQFIHRFKTSCSSWYKWKCLFQICKNDMYL